MLAAMGVQSHDIAFVQELDLGTSKPLIFDVGANVGEMAKLYKSKWPDAIVFCFEPEPAAFRELSRLVIDVPGVTAWRTAISDRAGVTELHLNGDADETASLHKRDLSYAGVPGFHPKSMTVPTKPLTYFLTGMKGEAVDLLKLDVEGHELKVLEGCGALLTPGRIKRITFEVNSCNLDSRTFLKDFWDLLHMRSGYILLQIMSDGKFHLIDKYRPELEDFAAHREFLAIDPLLHNPWTET